MKKIIAAALALLLGSIGYTVVDRSTDERLSSLEQTANSYSEVISSLNRSIDEICNPTTEYTEIVYGRDCTDIIEYNPEYHYGYLKVQLPDYSLYAEITAGINKNSISIVNNRGNYTLNGQEVSLLIRIPKNTSGNFELFISPKDSQQRFKLLSCCITETDGKMFVSDITYYDTSSVTSTTTTTTTIFYDITVK